jgi:hypothetical protein
MKFRMHIGASLAGLLAMTAAVAQDDPLQWLEEVDGEQALAWVKQQNAATAARLESQPLFDELYAQARAALNSTSRLPAIEQKGEWLYNLWPSRGSARSTSCVAGGPWKSGWPRRSSPCFGPSRRPGTIPRGWRRRWPP